MSTTDQIAYKKGYKYQLAEDYIRFIPIYFHDDIQTKYISLIPQPDLSSLLTIRTGYAWDGPSGPTIDTKTFMRGSLEHDALYQLIRERLLPQAYFRR